MTPYEMETAKPETLQESNKTFHVSLINNLQDHGLFENNRGQETNQGQLELPGLTLTDSTLARQDLPQGAEAVDYGINKYSLDNMRARCNQGTMERPSEQRVSSDNRTLFFKGVTDGESIDVAVRLERMPVADTNVAYPNRIAEVVAQRTELHEIAPGITVRVEITPPSSEIRENPMMVSPEDGYQLYVVDETEGKAYKYSHMKVLNDRSGLKDDLDRLRRHYSEGA